MDSADTSANTPAWLALLVVIAIASFFVLGDVIAHRDAHAAAWAGVTTTESFGDVVFPGVRATNGSIDPLSVLGDGVAASTANAADALSRGDVTVAAVAMDAALRAADVGRAGGSAASARAAFASAFALVTRARAERQNGNLAAAAATLNQVSDVLAADFPTQPALPRDVGGYEGARLLNAAGNTIGVVDHVSIATAGAPAMATLVIGGYHHVLGFMDFGGTARTVPVARLVFGKVRRLGRTRVVLATLAQTPDEIGRELGSR